MRAAVLVERTRAFRRESLRAALSRASSVSARAAPLSSPTPHAEDATSPSLFSRGGLGLGSAAALSAQMEAAADAAEAAAANAAAYGRCSFDVAAVDAPPSAAVVSAAERVLSLWSVVQSRPYTRAVLGRAASAAVRAYAALGTHRLAIGLFLTASAGGSRPPADAVGLAWTPAALEALLVSARSVGDVDAYMTLLPEIERLEGLLAEGGGGVDWGRPGDSVSRGGGQPIPCAAAARLEGLLEALVRKGDEHIGRAGPVLAALAAQDTPLKAGLFRLFTHSHVSRGLWEGAAGALREFARERRAALGRGDDPAVLLSSAGSDAKLAAHVFFESLKSAQPIAATVAYHVLRESAVLELVAFESSQGRGSHGSDGAFESSQGRGGHGSDGEDRLPEFGGGGGGGGGGGVSLDGARFLSAVLEALRDPATVSRAVAAHLRGSESFVRCLTVAARLGAIPLSEALASDALSHGPARSEIAALSAVGGGDVDESARVDVWVLNMLCVSSAVGDDVIGALRSASLAQRVAFLAGLDGEAVTRVARDAAARAARTLVIRLDTWERLLKKEGGGEDGGAGGGGGGGGPNFDGVETVIPGGGDDSASPSGAVEGGGGVESAAYGVEENSSTSPWGDWIAPPPTSARFQQAISAPSAPAAATADVMQHAPPPVTRPLAVVPPSDHLVTAYAAAASLLGLAPGTYVRGVDSLPGVPRSGDNFFARSGDPSDLSPARAEVLAALTVGYTSASYVGRLLGLAASEVDIMLPRGAHGGDAAPAVWSSALALVTSAATERLLSAAHSSPNDPASLIGVAGGLALGIIDGATVSPLTLSAALAGQHGGAPVALPKGNFGLFETLAQTLAEGGGGGPSRAAIAPAALSITLTALAGTRRRLLVPKLLDAALQAGLVTEAESFAAVVDALVLIPVVSVTAAKKGGGGACRATRARTMCS